MNTAFKELLEDPRCDQLNYREILVFWYLRSEGKQQAKVLARDLRMNQKQLGKVLRRLAQLGFIKVHRPVKHVTNLYLYEYLTIEEMERREKDGD